MSSGTFYEAVNDVLWR